MRYSCRSGVTCPIQPVPSASAFESCETTADVYQRAPAASFTMKVDAELGAYVSGPPPGAKNVRPLGSTRLTCQGENVSVLPSVLQLASRYVVPMAPLEGFGVKIFNTLSPAPAGVGSVCTT